MSRISFVKYLFLFLFFFSSKLYAADFLDPEWLALGHYEKNGNFYKSSADGDSFFLSKEGKSSPQFELQATIEAFTLPISADPNEHAQCRFPARFLWIQKTFLSESKKFPKVFCDRYEKWKMAINAKSAWVIFASAFVNSPASMYGHTLLRFSRGGKTEGNALLDYALSYGADIGSSTGLPYMWKGLTGQFPGSFTTAPFYLKVQEYNHVENRDFWEYELNLSPEELKLLVAHTWELKNASFAYYFLKRNCSYYLLRFLEVARPKLRLADEFLFWTIPADTIRVLEENNFIVKKVIRASRVNYFLRRRSMLTEKEILKAEDFSNSPHAFFTGEEQAETKALILDTAYDFFRYKAKVINVLSAEELAIENNILKNRTNITVAPMKLDFSQELPPEEGHKTSRFGIFMGKDKVNSFGDIRYRGALHDLLSDPIGFEPGSELTMGDIRARYIDKSIFLDFLEVLKIRSITPYDPWIQKTSWNISFGLDRAKDRKCKTWNCSYGFLDGGAGFAFAKNSENLFFLFLNGSLDIGSSLDKNWRFGVGPSLGVKLTPTPFWRILITSNYRTKVLGDKLGRSSLRFEQSFTWKKNREIRMEAEKRRTFQEYSLGHYWYF